MEGRTNKEASLSAHDFENFRTEELSQISSGPFGNPSAAPSILKDVDNLFLSKAKGKISQSLEEQETVKENTMKGILELIGQLSGLIQMQKHIIREKYQEDSDDDDVVIPDSDPFMGYVQNTYNEIGMALSKQFTKLVISNQSRKLSELQDEFINEVFINCDKQATLLAYSLDNNLRMINSTRDNVLSIIMHFTKTKNELYSAMGDSKTEIVVKKLETASKNFKFALINEAGLRLIDYISPNTTNEFKEILPKELNTLGNSLSCIIQEELEDKTTSYPSVSQCFEKYSPLLKHTKEVIDLVLVQLLESLKGIIDNSMAEVAYKAGESEDTCLEYLKVLKDFDTVVKPRVIKASQLFEAKLRYPIEAKLNPYGISPEVLVSQCKGFSAEKASTKAKLVYSE